MDQPKVLLVEDDSMLREIIALQLIDLGFYVVEVENAKAAINSLLTEPNFKLIISDLNMPGMTGLELAEWLKNNSKDVISNPSFVLMTGEADQLNSQKAKELNVSHVLAKPFGYDNLISILRSSLYSNGKLAA